MSGFARWSSIREVPSLGSPKTCGYLHAEQVSFKPADERARLPGVTGGGVIPFNTRSHTWSMDGKRIASAVSWIENRYGTVRKTAWFPKGKVVEHEMGTFRAAGTDEGTPKSPGPRALVSTLDRR